MCGLVTAVEDVVARDCWPSNADGAKELGNRADAAVGLLLEVIESRVQFGRGVAVGVQPENDGRNGVSGQLEALSWLLDEGRVGEERAGTAGVRELQGQARCVVLGAVIEWVLVCPTATSAVGGRTLLRTLEVSDRAYGCTKCLPLLRMSSLSCMPMMRTRYVSLAGPVPASAILRPGSIVAKMRFSHLVQM